MKRYSFSSVQSHATFSTRLRSACLMQLSPRTTQWIWYAERQCGTNQQHGRKRVTKTTAICPQAPLLASLPRPRADAELDLYEGMFHGFL